MSNSQYESENGRVNVGVVGWVLTFVVAGVKSQLLALPQLAACQIHSLLASWTLLYLLLKLYIGTCLHFLIEVIPFSDCPETEEIFISL